MSSGALQVRYPDGTIRYGTWHGTSSLAHDSLWDTEEGYYQHRPYSPVNGADLVEVEVAVNYGSGFHYRGLATPTQLITSDPYGYCHEDGNGPDITEPGLPDWAFVEVER